MPAEGGWETHQSKVNDSEDSRPETCVDGQDYQLEYHLP